MARARLTEEHGRQGAFRQCAAASGAVSVRASASPESLRPENRRPLRRQLAFRPLPSHQPPSKAIAEYTRLLDAPTAMPYPHSGAHLLQERGCPCFSRHGSAPTTVGIYRIEGAFRKASGNTEHVRLSAAPQAPPPWRSGDFFARNHLKRRRLSRCSTAGASHPERQPNAG